MKIYIAGAITGYTPEQFHAKFEECRDRVALKYPQAQIIIPTDLCPDDMGWADCMKICLNELKSCNLIYMMKDWKESKGATAEHIVAEILDIAIEYDE